MKKLSELVSSALSDAKTKIASAVSTPIAPPAAPAASVKTASDDSRVPPVVSPAAEKRASVRETAKEAMQFAESLDHLAALFPKIASSTMHVSGPEILTSPDKGKTQDSNTKATTLTHTEASTGGGPLNAKGQVPNDGSVGGVPNRFSKKAAEEILLAKVAQAEALMAVGRANEATKIANEAKAEFERAKKAYEEEDGSTKTPKGSPKSLETYVSGTSGAPGGVAPDNKSVASFTKRDGKKREIAPIAEHLREPAFSARSDKGLSDNLDHTQGAKIASVMDKAAARKAASAA